MKISNKLFINFLFCAALLTGCARTAPVFAPHTMITSHHTLEEIEAAFLKAGQKGEWIMTKFAPGVMDGRLIKRNHSVNIRINYDTTQYTIHYIHSTNLRASKGKIHRNYNRWINNLNEEIQRRLMNIRN